jgi:DNA ligase D-like protein (predicted ligase)
VHRRNSTRAHRFESARKDAKLGKNDPHLKMPRSKTRGELNALRVSAPDAPREAYHLYRCGECGQVVDRRSLGDVLVHEEPRHEATSEGLRFIPPMVPCLVGEPPAGDEWQHEIKYDGYRTQLIIDRHLVRAFTRNGHDWTDRFPAVVRCGSKLFCASAIIDGEIIVQDEQGRCDFHAIKGALTARPEAFVFMAFDLLCLNGRDLRSAPLVERREYLRELVGANEAGSCIQFSDHVTGDGSELFRAADAMGLEGIVSKRVTSRYRSGPAKNWLKVKCFDEAEFIVIGTARGEKAPVALLAKETAFGLEYAGAAMVTLGGDEREAFWLRNEQLKVSRPAIPMEPRKETSWLAPEMRVRARFLKGEEMLRHATVRRLMS